MLLRSLGPEHATDELVGVGMAPFYYLPHTIFVAERGLDHFELSLRAQYELTKRFSAVGSIRAFVAKDPERTFAQLRVWATDGNVYVRRLVSEGTRLRLPWASRVARLDANPRRVLALLELLKDDPTTLVRRSVANNLNDLSKDYAELTVETCRVWLGAESPGLLALVHHALRSLVKKGHRGALALLGAGARPRVEVGPARLSAKSIPLRSAIRFSFGVERAALQGQQLVVDFAEYVVKANGGARAKVFKLKRVTLEANAVLTCQAFAVGNARIAEVLRVLSETRFTLKGLRIANARPARIRAALAVVLQRETPDARFRVRITEGRCREMCAVGVLGAARALSGFAEGGGGLGAVCVV